MSESLQERMTIAPSIWDEAVKLAKERGTSPMKQIELAWIAYKREQAK